MLTIINEKVKASTNERARIELQVHKYKSTHIHITLKTLSELRSNSAKFYKIQNHFNTFSTYFVTQQIVSNGGFTLCKKVYTMFTPKIYLQALKLPGCRVSLCPFSTPQKINDSVLSQINVSALVSHPTFPYFLTLLSRIISPVLSSP